MIFLRRCTTNSCASHADPVTTWHLADTQLHWLSWVNSHGSSDHHFLRRRHSFMDKTSGQQIFGTGPNVLAATKFHHGERRLLLEDSIQWSHTPVNPTKLKVFWLVGKPSARSFEWLLADPIASWWEEVSSRRLLYRKVGRWPHTGIQDRTTPNTLPN